MTRSTAESLLIGQYARAITAAGSANGWSDDPAIDESPRVYLNTPLLDALSWMGLTVADAEAVADVDLTGVIDERQFRLATRIAFIESILTPLRFVFFDQSSNGRSQSLSQVIKGLEADLAGLKKDYEAVYPVAGATSPTIIGGRLCRTPWAGSGSYYGNRWRGY
jgi:hypothetical protein